jgi:hypothetical protein
MEQRQNDTEFTPTQDWALPTDPAGFKAWLFERGITFEEFRTYPGWLNAPAPLRSAMEEADSTGGGSAGR